MNHFGRVLLPVELASLLCLTSPMGHMGPSLGLAIVVKPD
jgi:hypothetical protein